MLTGKKFSTNEEVITETEAYFETYLLFDYAGSTQNHKKISETRIFQSGKFSLKKLCFVVW
jgi:hypothetical protein